MAPTAASSRRSKYDKQQRRPPASARSKKKSGGGAAESSSPSILSYFSPTSASRTAGGGGTNAAPGAAATRPSSAAAKAAAAAAAPSEPSPGGGTKRKSRSDRQQRPSPPASPSLPAGAPPARGPAGSAAANRRSTRAASTAATAAAKTKKKPPTSSSSTTAKTAKFKTKPTNNPKRTTPEQTGKQEASVGPSSATTAIDDDSENVINGSSESTKRRRRAASAAAAGAAAASAGLGGTAAPRSGSPVEGKGRGDDDDSSSGGRRKRDRDGAKAAASAAGGGAESAGAAADSGGGAEARSSAAAASASGGDGGGGQKKARRTAPTAAAAAAAAAEIKATAISSPSQASAPPPGASKAAAPKSRAAPTPTSSAAVAAPAGGASTPSAAATAAAAAAAPVVTSETHGLALIRVPTSQVQTYSPLEDISRDSYTPSSSEGGDKKERRAAKAKAGAVPRPRPTLHPLRPGAVLGRTAGGRLPPGKIDLGIGADADGVSRRHLTVVEANVAGGGGGGGGGTTSSSGKKGRHHHHRRGYVTLQVSKTISTRPNLAHFGQKQHRSGGGGGGPPPVRQTNVYPPSSTIVMRVGDVLTMDNYRTKDGRDRRPVHMFQLVRYRKTETETATDDPPLLRTFESAEAMVAPAPADEAGKKPTRAPREAGSSAAAAAAAAAASSKVNGDGGAGSAPSPARAASLGSSLKTPPAEDDDDDEEGGARTVPRKSNRKSMMSSGASVSASDAKASAGRRGRGGSSSPSPLAAAAAAPTTPMATPTQPLTGVGPTDAPDGGVKGQQQRGGGGGGGGEMPSATPTDDHHRNPSSPNPPPPPSASSLLAVGDLVTVESRTWPGVNKPGGVGRVVRVHTAATATDTKLATTATGTADGGLIDGQVVDVKYVLGGVEKNIDFKYVTEHADLERLRDAPTPNKKYQEEEKKEEEVEVKKGGGGIVVPPPTTQQLARDGAGEEEELKRRPTRRSRRAVIKREGKDDDNDGKIGEDDKADNHPTVKVAVNKPPAVVPYPPEPPALGDRFRVEFKMTNFLGVESTEWYFGTAVQIDKVVKGAAAAAPQRYKVGLKFDDVSTTTVDYPGDDQVQKLVPRRVDDHAADGDGAREGTARRGGGGEGRRPRGAAAAAAGGAASEEQSESEAVEPALYPEGGGGGDGSNASEASCVIVAAAAAYDPNPSHLTLGDYVDCRYQDGSSNGAWFRGRVASVAATVDGGGGGDDDDRTIRFDVAYDDGEYECNIPLQPGNVRLVKRGSYDCTWLHGLQFDAPTSRRGGSKKKKAVARRGRIVGVYRPKDDEFNTAGTKSKFADHHVHAQVNVRFDDDSTEVMDYGDIVEVLFTAHRDKCSRLEKVKDWPIKNDSAAAAAAPNVKSGPSASKPSARSKTKKVRAQSHPPTDNAGSDRSNIVSPYDGLDNNDIDRLLDERPQESQFSQESFSESPPRVGSKEKAREMHPSLANSLWSALNSAEPHNGATLLRHSIVFHNTLPNATLSKNLFELMKSGPKSEGVSFRDPNRLELASRCVSVALSKAETLDASSAASFGPSSWDDVEHCLSLPINETKQIVSIASIKSSPSAARRLGQSLQVAASGLECISKLLQLELSGAMKEQEQAVNARRLYVTKPTVNAALQCNVREALKSAVRWTAQCWIRHGHLIIGDGKELALPESPDEEWCAVEAKLCLDSLGRIVAYLSWLYCEEECVALKDNDCSFLIVDALLSELEKGQSESGTAGKKKSAAAWKHFSKRVKIWFILSLDKDFAAPLQANLSKMLHLSKEMGYLLR